MKLTVFSPTGSAGEQLVRQALAAGHEVTSVARRPDAVTPTDPRLRVVLGDVLDPASLHDGVVWADAVLSALGSRQMNRPTKVYSADTAAVLAAMCDAGARRFVGVTAIPVGSEDQKSALERCLVHPLLHRFFGGGYDDMRRIEDLLAASDRDWTVFRPPRSPTEHRRGAARAWSVSRADLAAAKLAAAQDPALVGHAVTIAV